MCVWKEEGEPGGAWKEEGEPGGAWIGSGISKPSLLVDWVSGGEVLGVAGAAAFCQQDPSVSG